MNETNYAFAVAKIRSLENRLVQPNQIERIIDSDNASSFFDALSDTAYAKHFPANHDILQFQEVLNKELTESKKILCAIVPDASQLDWLWYKYDFLNLKFIVKSYLASVPIQKNNLLDIGNIKVDNFIQYLEKSQKGLLDNVFTDVIQKCQSDFQNNKEPKNIDLIADSKYYNILSKQLNKIHSPLIKKIIAQKIDLYNLKVIFRAKQLNFEVKQISDYISEGGNISKDKIISVYSDDIANIATNPTFREYSYILKNSIEYYENTKSFLVFEKLTHEHFVESLRHAKYLAFGIEPLVAYWLAKDNEVKILRIITSSKLSDIDSKTIHQQIHKLYTQK